jgi:hypothetical protein
MEAHSIAGEWRGHYQYRKLPDHGCSFSAFFSESSGQIDGTIVDDFAPGEARLEGSFAFPSLQFTKVYLNTIYSVAPIDYVGSMSQDGKTISGTWTIKNDHSTSGTWTAHRLNEEAVDLAKKKARRVGTPQVEDALI